MTQVAPAIYRQVLRKRRRGTPSYLASAPASISASVSISASASALLYAVPFMSASVTKRLTVTASSDSIASMVASPAITLTAVPRLYGITDAAATVTITLTASQADGSATGGMVADASIVLTGDAAIINGVIEGEADAGIVLTATADLSATTSIAASADIVLLANARFDVGCLDAIQIELRPGLTARGVCIGGRLDARPVIVERLTAKGVELCQLKTSTSRQTTLSG